MSLQRTDVEKIAHLARLALEPEETEGFVADLSQILDLVGEMETADTDGVKLMAHPLDMVQRLRPDEVTETVQREILQPLGPQTESGFYLVPRVIE